MDTLLVTGGSGQVGSAVIRAATRLGLDVWAPKRASLDLADIDAIRTVVRNRRWSAIVNCAAHTAVDKAETEPELARAINGIAPAIFAEEAGTAGIPLIHVSTDYVFDGNKILPYDENDPVNPVGVYGCTKAEGEAAIVATNARHAIVRTAWVLSEGGSNFLDTMLRLGAERPEIRVVEDQIGCPSSANDIAQALLIVAQGLEDRSGIWHFVNKGAASWHDLATHIFAATKRRGLRSPIVMPIATQEYPTAAKRPTNSRLATKKIETDFGIVPRPWQEAVDEILNIRLGQA